MGYWLYPPWLRLHTNGAGGGTTFIYTSNKWYVCRSTQWNFCFQGVMNTLYIGGSGWCWKMIYSLVWRVSREVFWARSSSWGWLFSFDFDNIFLENKYSERKSKWITSVAIEWSVQMYCKQIRFGAGVKSNKRLKDIGAVGPIHSLAGQTRACYITQHPASQNCLVRLFVQNWHYCWDQWKNPSL